MTKEEWQAKKAATKKTAGIVYRGEAGDGYTAVEIVKLHRAKIALMLHREAKKAATKQKEKTDDL